MSKIKLLTIAVVALILMNFGLLTFLIVNRPGHSPRGGRGPIENGPKGMIIKKLDLNNEQISEYEKMIERHQVTIMALNDEVRNTKTSLFATLATDTPMSADSLINRLGTIQAQIEKVHYNHFSELESICRPDQKQKFKELAKELANYFELPKELSQQ